MDTATLETTETTATTATSELEFNIEKEVLLNGLRIVERATAQKGLQPVLANILIDGTEKNKIKFYATDFDLTIITSVEAQILSPGKITLPAKKLVDIISRLNDGIIEFKLNNTIMNIKSGKSKFDIIGIPAMEFPRIDYLTEEDANKIEIDLKPLIIGIKEAGGASSPFESNNSLLSGVICDINKNILEIASTDGNRLARARKIITNKDESSIRLIIPAKVLQEFLKISAYIDEDTIQIYTKTNKLMIKSENITLISNLMNGQYPQYNQLIPQSFTKQAKVNVAKMLSQLELVSTMTTDKNTTIKLNFDNNCLYMMVDAPEMGNSQSEIDIIYSGEEILIAFNYKYLIDSLRNIDAEEAIICMNTNLSSTVIKPDNDEDFIYLIMPVQIR